MSVDKKIRKNLSIKHAVQQWRQVAPRVEKAAPAKEEQIDLTGELREPLDCLIDMLAVAVQLEFGTIPPYLCALWSIKNDRHPVANSIREVVQEEMLHLALTCNLMAALNVQPKLTEWGMSYPGKLPGDVHVNLDVDLRGLDDAALVGFITIESPQVKPPNVQQDKIDEWLDEQIQVSCAQTIGELYEEILDAFDRLKPDLNVDRQISGPLAWKVISTPAEVKAAIHLIMRQGEGALIEPLDSSKEDLAHYYRFLEVFKQKRLVYDRREKKYLWQGKLERPECWNMAPTKDWYKPPKPKSPKDSAVDEEKRNWKLAHATGNAEVDQLVNSFDRTYTRMLAQLEQAWTAGGQGCLIRAIDLMFELEKFAKPLMRISLRDDDESPSPLTYGPLFRYRPELLNEKNP